MTLNLEQIYVLLLLFSIGVWLLLEKDHDVAAGVLLGILVAIKPNIAVWPLFLALSGRTKPILPACLTTAMLSILPIALYGRNVYTQWLFAAKISDHSIFPEDVSIAGNFTRMGSRGIGLAAALAVIVVLIFIVRATRPNLYDTTGIALCASILCSPLGWMHYSLLLAPILFVKSWTPRIAVAALLLWINPAFIDPQPYASHWSAFFRGLIYFIPMCLLLVEFCRPALRTLALRFQSDYNLSPLGDN